MTRLAWGVIRSAAESAAQTGALPNTNPDPLDKLSGKHFHPSRRHPRGQIVAGFLPLKAQVVAAALHGQQLFTRGNQLQGPRQFFDAAKWIARAVNKETG